MQVYDKIIIGAGLYGLYAALFAAKQGDRVLVLEYDNAPFKRATYINQARVHMGYHYPRSYSTAIKSAGYFRRFVDDFGFCINRDFAQVYATSANFSWSDAAQFRHFCDNAGIPCEEVAPSRYFREGMCDGAFLTREYTYDAQVLKKHFLTELAAQPRVEMRYGVRLRAIEQQESCYEVTLADGTRCATEFLLNATYASANQVIALVNEGRRGREDFSANKLDDIQCRSEGILKQVQDDEAFRQDDSQSRPEGTSVKPATTSWSPSPSKGRLGVQGDEALRDNDLPLFGIKYELCEIILCDVSDKLKDTGITVMDGPFFSIMPFGMTGYHSLTAVTFTPHVTSYEALPQFACQAKSSSFCSPAQLGNCNNCPARPESAWGYMSQLAHKYLRDEYGFGYRESLFSMKPILQASEVDDSRPTVIRVLTEKPMFVSVLSGKINTVYDLDEILR